MKKIPILFALFLVAGACLVALSHSASHEENELQATQAAWQAQSRELAEIQARTAELKLKISDRRKELRDSEVTAAMDPQLMTFLLTNDVRQASPKMQERVLTSFGRGENSSGGYVLVSKAVLAGAHLRPLETFPNREKLTDAMRGVLAITPEEQQAVESAFARAFDGMGTWSRDNMKRDGPAGDRLVQYTIPEDRAFHDSLTGKLFSDINSAIGNERGELLRKSFEQYRLYEDGAVGDRTNVLSIHRIAAAPGYGARNGWRWADGSESINTDPEALKPGRFPPAFRFIFPGGWEDVAEHEGFELPDEFKNR